MGCGSVMPRFFVEKDAVRQDGKIVLVGEDARHISLSLRAKTGEKITVSDGEGTDYSCEICSISKESVELGILCQKKSETEPTLDVVLYQALVKSDKFDFIVQKCTELGVARIVPVITERCISRPDTATLEKKTLRWRKIVREASMQSGRGRIPTVDVAVSYEVALDKMKNDDVSFLCYESVPHEAIDLIYKKQTGGKVPKSASFLVGPEGGISENEVRMALDANISLASLGPRILRAETAPLCVISSLMLLSGNMN